jgi:hypothetical protein
VRRERVVDDGDGHARIVAGTVGRVAPVTWEDIAIGTGSWQDCATMQAFFGDWYSTFGRRPG